MPLVGFRANPEKHRRILDYLKPFLANKMSSEETRRLIELGLDVVEGKYVKQGAQVVRQDASRTSHLPWLNKQLKQ